MARLEAKADLCHVPTPPCVIQSLAALLRIPEHASVLDPCCGTGEALQALAPTADRFGIELDGRRAVAAKTRFKSVVACAMQDARISNEAFGLLFLNPPYDDSTEGRLEAVFLDRCTRYLEPGGVLVLIIKENGFDPVLPTLRKHYDIIDHWRFPDGWYAGPHLSFGQTVLVARRRAVEAVRSATDFYKTLRIGALSPLPTSFDIRVDVPLGKNPRTFISAVLREEDLISLLATSTLSREMKVPNLIGCGSPLLPLKQGHLAMMLASGCVNGVYGSGPTRHVAKGTVIRLKKTEHAVDETTGGNPALIRKETDYFAIQIRAMTAAGVICEMTADPVAEEEDDDAVEG